MVMASSSINESQTFHEVVWSWDLKTFMTRCHANNSSMEHTFSNIIDETDAYMLAIVKLRASREIDQQLTIPAAASKTIYKFVWRWAMKSFMTGVARCAILLPITTIFYIVWRVNQFVLDFFSPIYTQLYIYVFGYGLTTSVTFIFLIATFMSSWLQASVPSLQESFIKRISFVRYLYNASNKISFVISPDDNPHVSRVVKIIRHSHNGEYALGLIIMSPLLQVSVTSRKPMGKEIVKSKNVSRSQYQTKLTTIKVRKPEIEHNYSEADSLCCVYVPSTHLYIGAIFVVDANVLIKPNRFVWEEIEIVVSYHLSMPHILLTYSVDGSLSDFFECSREMIRDTFSRQNLFQKIDSEGNIYIYQRTLNSAFTFRSTSSSRSFVTHTNNYSSIDSPLSPTTSEKMSKGPNFIDNLMRPEVIPSLPMQITLEKHFENKNISSQGERSLMKREESDIEHTTTKITEIGVQDTKMMLRKLQVKEDPPSTTIDSKKGALNSNKMGNKIEVKKSQIKMINKEGRASRSKRVAQKLEEKEAMFKQKGVNKMNGYGHVSKWPDRKEAIDKKSHKSPKVTVTSCKLKEKENVIKQKGFNKLNTSNHETHQPHEEEIEKKVDKIFKVAVNSRKLVEKGTVESRNASRTQDQAKEIARKIRKPANGLYFTRNKITHEQNTTPIAISNCRNKTVNHASNNRKRGLTMREEPTTEYILAKLITRDEEHKENDSILEFDDNTLDDLLPELEEIYSFQIGEHSNNNQSSPCETCWISDFIVTDKRLSRDCQNDPIFPDSKVVRPLSLSCLMNPAMCVALHQLLEEVNEAVETWRSSSKLSLYKMLKREIGCFIEGGTWDLSWRSDCSLDDIKKVVSDLEELVLTSKLVG